MPVPLPLAAARKKVEDGPAWLVPDTVTLPVDESLTYTLPAVVAPSDDALVAIAADGVPISPLPEVIVSEPVDTEPCDWVIVPEPLAVKVTLFAAVMLFARARLPLLMVAR